MSRTLTLHQPWASLVALGVKTIETRSWSTDHRGPLLIHASARRPDMMRLGDWSSEPTWRRESGLLVGEAGEPHRLPLGAIVASCTLADVVPMVEPDDATDQPHLLVAGRHTGRMMVYFPGEDYHGPQDPGFYFSWRHYDVEDQRPYGDFAPGRFAWLLEDVKATTERCPACWGSGWWAPEGYRSVPDSYDRCPTCDGEGSCDPIPAKGKQRLWEWTP